MIDDFFNDNLVLARGNYLKFEWVVKYNQIGYRCGYVFVNKDHPWNIDLSEIEVHGGVSYTSANEEGLWLGFDCAHYNDAPDPSLFPEVGRFFIAEFLEIAGHIWSTHEVIDECKNLCQQAYNAYRCHDDDMSFYKFGL